MRSSLRFLAVVLAISLFASSCSDGGDGPPPLTPTMSAEFLLETLDLGATYCEIDDTENARRCYQLPGLPADPAIAYNLAVVDGMEDPVRGREAMNRLLEGSPDPALLGRIAHAAGSFALQAGDIEAAIPLLEQAVAAEPKQRAFAFSLAEAFRLSRNNAGAITMLRTAWQARERPNALVAAELALATAAHEDAAVRREGLSALAATLAEAGGGDDLGEAFTAARTQILETPGVPRELRIAVNLLRGTARFQRDAREIRSDQETRPLRRPIHPVAPRGRADLTGLSLTVDDGVAPVPAALHHAVGFDYESAEGRGATTGRALAVGSTGLLELSGGAWNQAEAAVTGRPRGLDLGDLDGDGQVEAVVYTDRGLFVADRDETGAWQARDLPHLAGIGPVAHALIVDHNHDGHLDVLVLAEEAEGSNNLLLVRNQSGDLALGAPQAFPVQLEGDFDRVVASDLDGDHDLDLVLAGLPGLFQLTNEREEIFTAHRIASLPPVVSSLVVGDVTRARGGAPDAHPDVVVVADGKLLVVAGSSTGLVAGSERDLTSKVGEQLIPRGAQILDVDLDGRLDLVVLGRGIEDDSAGVAILRGPTLRLAELGDAPLPRSLAGLVVLEHSGSGATSLLGWNPSGESIGLTLTTDTEPSWLALQLETPETDLQGAKVPMDASGTRVEVRTSVGRQIQDVAGPNVVVGVPQTTDGPASVHVVKITWPNGMSEYLFEPEMHRRHDVLLEIRLEGSCPFLYAWDGEKHEFVTDVLGISPLGMQVAPHVHNDLHPEEYLRLPDWMELRSGKLELVFTEELREVTFLDQIELVAVDTPREVLAYNAERFVMPPVEGLALELLGPLESIDSATSDGGEDVTAILLELDHEYLTNHRGRTRYQGLVQPHTLTLDLGEIVVRTDNRVALLFDGWLQWGNTSTNVAVGHDPEVDFLFPVMEVPDGEGGWREIPAQLGLPAGKPKPVAIDLSGQLVPTDPRVRIRTNMEVFWDRIAVAEALPGAETEHRIQTLSASRADYRFGGYSRHYRPAPNGPDLFDYSDRAPFPRRTDAEGNETRYSFAELEGFYVEYGDVLDLVTDKDDLSVTVGAGEEILLHFDPSRIEPPPEGWRRTWFLHSEGWDKDGDLNTAHGQTLEPLPFHARKAYPSGEPFPDTEAHRRYVRERLTRWVPSDRLDRLARMPATREED